MRPMKPFRFLDLPLELQRKVLANYYEEPWTVEFVAVKDHGYGFQSVYRFDLPGGLLFVNRHLHEEAKLAIANTRGNTYVVPSQRKPMALTFVPAFWNKATSKIEVHCVHRQNLQHLRQYLPNLEKIEQDVFHHSRFLRDTARIMHSHDIFELLSGKYDGEIAASVHKNFKSLLKACDRPENLSGMIVSGWVYTCQLGQRWVIRPYRGVGLDASLCFRVEVSDKGARVNGKRFARGSLRFGAGDLPCARTGIEATEAFLEECCRVDETIPRGRKRRVLEETPEA